MGQKKGEGCFLKKGRNWVGQLAVGMGKREWSDKLIRHDRQDWVLGGLM